MERPTGLETCGVDARPISGGRRIIQGRLLGPPYLNLTWFVGIKAAAAVICFVDCAGHGSYGYQIKTGLWGPEMTSLSSLNTSKSHGSHALYPLVSSISNEMRVN